jgi:hypothetical protein
MDYTFCEQLWMNYKPQIFIMPSALKQRSLKLKLDDMIQVQPLTDNQKISTADYADYFKLYDKHVEKHGALKQKAVKGAIFEIFPSATEVRIGNLQAIGFSTVDVMRQEFQAYLTHDIAEWNLPTNTNGDK